MFRCLVLQKLDKDLPVRKLDKQKLNNPNKDEIQVTWLGHACVFIQMEGVNILADPMFGTYASPVGFAGPARYRPVPSSLGENVEESNVSKIVNDLGIDRVDCVIISHNHYDHLDKGSIQALWKQYPNSRFFVPKGVESWIIDNTKPGLKDRVSSCE